MKIIDKAKEKIIGIKEKVKEDREQKRVLKEERRKKREQERLEREKREAEERLEREKKEAEERKERMLKKISDLKNKAIEFNISPELLMMLEMQDNFGKEFQEIKDDIYYIKTEQMYMRSDIDDLQSQKNC